MSSKPFRYGTSFPWRRILLLVAVASLIVLLHVGGFGEKLVHLREWIRSFGSFGPLVFVVIYILAVVAAVPGTAITIVGATLFGSLMGVVLVSVASTIGASIAFLVARYLAREAVLRWLSRNDTFRKLDHLTRSKSAIVVAIVRLVPLFPFNIVNYGFGLTGVPFWTYVFWSWLCMLPGTALYVVGADAVVSGLLQGKIPWVLLMAFAAVGVILAVLVSVARRRLQSGIDEADEGSGNEGDR